jgi:hypothetical protein
MYVAQVIGLPFRQKMHPGMAARDGSCRLMVVPIITGLLIEGLKDSIQINLGVIPGAFY